MTTSMKFAPQLRLLLWKNLLLQKKKKCITICEILVPVLFGLILWAVRRENPRTTKVLAFAFPPSCTFNRFGRPDGSRVPGNVTLKYAPATNLTRRLMAGAVQRLKTYAGDDAAATDLWNLEVLDMTPNTGPEDEETNQTKDDPWLGVLFEGLDDASSLPQHVHYSLIPRFNTSYMDGAFWPRALYRYPLKKGPEEQYKRSGWFAEEGLLALQVALGEELISMWANQSLDLTLCTEMMPFPAHEIDRVVKIITEGLPTYIIFSVILPVVMLTKSITYEKEKKLKESMKLMGMLTSSYWVSWFLTYFLILAVVMQFFAMLLCLPISGDVPVLWDSDISLISAFLLCYTVATLTYGIMMSVFFQTANKAAVASGLVFLLSSHLIFEDLPRVESHAVKIGFSFFVNFAAALGVNAISEKYDEGHGGIKWSNYNKPMYPSTYALADSMTMLLVDTVLHLTITWYVDAIYPGEFGIPQSYFFFLHKSYWVGSAARPDFQVTSEPKNRRFFEEEPRNRVAGIKICNLTKVFGANKPSVDNLCLNMYEGQITVILGHNGAGKTTTMFMLTGFFPPTSGNAYINGFDIRTDIAGVRSSLGLCPQHDVLFDDLTVKQHLHLFGKLKGCAGQELKQEVDSLMQQTGLVEKRFSKSKTLSGGQRRRLAIAIALIGGSKVVILDEPTSGVDPASRRELWTLLQRNREGRTMMLSTHFMDEADALGNRIAIMADGGLVCCGSPMFLKRAYGTGYHLIVIKGQGCVVPIVSALVKKMVPGTKLTRDVRAELTYLMPSAQVALFPELFRRLEGDKEMLRIVDFGATATTMEDVFLLAGQSAEVGARPQDRNTSYCSDSGHPVCAQIVTNLQSTSGINMCVGLGLTNENGRLQRPPGLSRNRAALSSRSECSLHSARGRLASLSPRDATKGSSAFSLHQSCEIETSSHCSSRNLSVADSTSDLDFNRMYDSNQNSGGPINIKSISSITSSTVESSSSVASSTTSGATSKSSSGSDTDKSDRDVTARDIASKITTAYRTTSASVRPGMPPSSATSVGEKPIYKTEFGTSLPAYTKLHGRPLVISQMHGVLAKRLIHAKRSFIWTITFLVVPAVFLLLDVDVGIKARRRGGGVFDLRLFPSSIVTYMVRSYDQTTLGVMESYRKLFDSSVTVTELEATEQGMTQALSTRLELKNHDHIIAAEFLRFTDKNSSSLLQASNLSGLDFRASKRSDENRVTDAKDIDGLVLDRNVNMPLPDSLFLTAFYNSLSVSGQPISMSYMLNALARHFAARDVSITTSIRLLQKRPSNMTKLEKTETPSFGTAIRASLGMAFIAPLFIHFLIYERVVGARHLQVVSGVSPAVFWLTNLAWDMLQYTLAAGLMLGVFAGFTAPVFRPSEHLDLAALVLMSYGWAMLGCSYFFQKIFSTPAGGTSGFIVLNVLNGVIMVTTIYILKLLKEKLAVDIVKVLELALITLSPIFCLTQSLFDIGLNWENTEECRKVQFNCEFLEGVCCGQCQGKQCHPFNINEDYLGWRRPGIGTFLLALFLQGAVYLWLTIFVESDAIRRLTANLLRFTWSPEKGELAEDSDVAAERARIVALPPEHLGQHDSLVLVNLYKRFGRLEAVKHVCARILDGECFGLLGQNGAGKTSIFKMLTGELVMSGGNAYFKTCDIKSHLKMVHRNMGYCPQSHAVLTQMTGRETLTLYARLKGVPDTDLDHVVDFLMRGLALTPYADKLAGKYSGGNMRKLSVGIALVGNPHFVLLDEPSSGMDAGAKRAMWDVLSDVRASGKTLVFTSHSMEEAEALCTSIAIMVNGRFVCLGSTQHLKTKFGQGYTVIVQMDRREDGYPEAFEPVVEGVRLRYPHAVVFEAHDGHVQLQVPDKDVKLADLFEVMEQLKVSLPVQDYNVQQTSLEQVFLYFTRNQEPPSEPKVISCCGCTR